MVSPRTRNRLIALALGPGFAAALIVPATAVGSSEGARQASSNASCAYAFRDTKTDAPAPFTGQQQNQLDLVQGTLGLNSTRKKLRVVMSIKNLSKKVPSGSNFNSYDFYWTNPAGDRGPNAVEVQVSSSGSVTYSDGTESTVGGNFQYTPSSTSAAHGSFGSGRNGKIEVDVPLSELKLKVGKVLSKPSAYSATGANAHVTSLGSIVDQDGPGHNYKLGQPTCIDPARPR